MKTTTIPFLTLALLTACLVLAGSRPAAADQYGPNHPYVYGHNGYWDEHHGYHRWDHYNNHDGYWYRRNDGVRIFISI